MQIGTATIKLKPDFDDRAFLTAGAVGGFAAYRFGIGQSFSMLAPGIGPKIGMGLTAAAFGVIGQNVAQAARKDPSVGNLALTVGLGAGVSGVAAGLLGGINGVVASKLLERPSAIVASEAAGNAFRYAKFGAAVGAAVGLGVAAEELISHALHRK